MRPVFLGIGGNLVPDGFATVRDGCAAAIDMLAETGFSDRLLHGEGVALGMVLAARYSARRGALSLDDARRVTRAVDAAGLPAEISALGLKCDGRRLADHMLHDKKMDAGTLPFILLRAIGEAHLARDVELADVAAFLDEELQAH